jgi:ornithine cyclodeaminase
MTRVVSRAELERVLPQLDLVAEMERAFVALSDGRCVVPPVGELRFDDPPGDVHVKYGYVRGEEWYVVKVASGFSRNPARGLPVGNGLMLLFDQATGAPRAVLLDEGVLTDQRTAAAGAVAAKHLAPRDVRAIGVLGTGAQARLQALHLRGVVDCARLLLWGRDARRAAACAADLERGGYEVTVCADAAEVAHGCELLVTSTRPLFPADAVRPGTHVTAMGADTADKQELDCALLARAERVVVDSRAQAELRGEVAVALRAGVLELDDVVELGALIAGHAPGRTAASDVTIVDLTGVAVQDVAIARAVLCQLEART